MNEYDSKKRYLGEFHTPLNFAEKSIEYICNVIPKEELYSGKFRIWDMSCASGNLEYYIDKKYHKYLYMSTIEKSDIEKCREKFKNACLFQYDYLNDDIDNNGFKYKKLPNKLIKDLNNKNIKLLIFINPPYATSQVAGTNSKSKKNVSISRIRNMMHNEKLGDASRELYAQFMFRVYKEFINIKDVYLALFSKTNYIKYRNNEKFRDKVCNYKFLKGFIFSSSNFENTSKTAPFPVSFIIWKINGSFNIKTENIILDVLDSSLNILGRKEYNVSDGSNLLNKWIKREKTSSVFVPLSSAVKVKTHGKDIRDKICTGFIGSLMSCGNDLQKQNLTAIFSAPQASAGSLSITKENFEKAMIVHAVRRNAKVDWLNASDQFCIPKKELDRKFILDCIVWSLFSASNQTSSMSSVLYKNNYYTIINNFYPFNYKEVYSKCGFFKFNNEKRFAFEYLEKNKEYISYEALELIESAKILYKFFYSNADKINKEKFKISLWDLGFWQIRKSLKDAELGSDILKEIKNKRSCLKANIYKDIDNFIF